MKKSTIVIILAVFFTFLSTGTSSAEILSVSPPVFDRPAGTYTFTVVSNGGLPLFIAWDPSQAAPPGVPPWAYNDCTYAGVPNTYECVVHGAPGVGISNSFHIEIMENLYSNPVATHIAHSEDETCYCTSGIICVDTDPNAVRLTVFEANSDSNTALLLGAISLVVVGVILTWKFRKRKKDLSI